MNKTPRKAIVVGTDGTPTAARAVARAAELARAEGAVLHIVTAYNPTLTPTEREDQAAMPSEMQWIASPGEAAERIARSAADGVDVPTEIHALAGDASDVLLHVAAETEASVLVVGNKGMAGLSGFVRPSVPNRITHKARCDVLVVDTRDTAA